MCNVFMLEMYTVNGRCFRIVIYLKFTNVVLHLDILPPVVCRRTHGFAFE